MEPLSTENHDSLLDRDPTEIHRSTTKKSFSLSPQVPTQIHQSWDLNFNTEEPKRFSATYVPQNGMLNLESHYRGDGTGDLVEGSVSQNTSDNEICVEEVLELLEGLLSTTSKPSLDHMDDFSPNSNVPLDSGLFTTGLPSPSYQHVILEDTQTHQYEAPLTPPESPNPSLLTMDIHSLFSNPYNTPSASDRVGPSAVQTLLNHAEEVLTRLQTAYAKCSSALNEMTLSRDQLVEKFEQSETRARHLSSQLETLSHTNTVNQQRIAELESVLKENHTTSLSFSRQLTDENKENQSLDVRSHSQSESSALSRETHSNPSYPHLERCQDTQKRCHENDTHAKAPIHINSKSTVPKKSIPDLKIVSSQQHSPSLWTSKIQGFSPGRQASPALLSPFSWNFLNIFHCHRYNKNTHLSLPMGNYCTSCLGKDSKCAWDTVGILKEENKYLKKRICELEESIDGVLDIVRIT